MAMDDGRYSIEFIEFAVNVAPCACGNVSSCIHKVYSAMEVESVESCAVVTGADMSSPS